MHRRLTVVCVCVCPCVLYHAKMVYYMTYHNDPWHFLLTEVPPTVLNKTSKEYVICARSSKQLALHKSDWLFLLASLAHVIMCMPDVVHYVVTFLISKIPDHGTCQVFTLASKAINYGAKDSGLTCKPRYTDNTHLRCSYVQTYLLKLLG